MDLVFGKSCKKIFYLEKLYFSDIYVTINKIKKKLSL